jgi:hypothetical protein
VTFRYPHPDNTSLVKLSSSGSPFTQDNLNIFFYGDSITWLDAYQPVIGKSLASGAATNRLNITLTNQVRWARRTPRKHAYI